MTARDCPYVGLTAYEEDNAEFFFGREREIDLVQANLQAARLTLLYGESGVGKSSILLAGVMRALHTEVEQNLERLRRDAGAEDDEEPEKPALAIAFFRGPWVDPPLPRLMETIHSAVQQAVGGDVPAWTAGDDVGATLRGWTERVRTILVVLDQFEEYFLYHPADEGGKTVAGMLPAVVNDPNLRVNFLLSIREDALAKLDRFKKHIPIFGNVLRINYLDEAAATDAIERPLERFSKLAGNGGGSYRAEPELVAEIIRQVRTGRVQLAGTAAGGGEASGNGGVETPVLQLVLTRLWDEERALDSRVLRLETFRDRLQGAESIVRTQLDRTMATLSEPEKDVAARAFRYLVTPSGSKFAQSISDLAGFAEVPREQLESVLEKLAGGRILRPVPPPPGRDEARYEIFHDALGPTVLDWSTRHLEVRAREEAEAEAEAETAKARRRARIWAGVGIASLLLAVGVALLAYDAVQQRREADRARDAAQGARSLARAQALLPVDPHKAIEAALASVEPEPTKEAASALRESLSQSRLRFVHTGKQALSEVTVSPAGDWVLSAGAEGAARLINPSSGEVKVLEGHESGVVAAAFDPKGERVVTADESGVGFIWDVATGSRIAVPEEEYVAAVAFSPTDPVVATGSSLDGIPRIWDAASGRRLARLGRPSDGWLTALAFSPRGDWLATGDWEGGVLLWQRPPGGWRNVAKPTRRLAGDAEHVDWVNSLSFSRDGQRLVSASDDDSAVIWNVRTGEYEHDLRDQQGSVLDAAFSADGTLASIAGKTLRLWDEDGEESQRLSASTDWLYDVAFRPDGRLVLAAGADGVVRLWEAATGGLLFELRGHTGAVNSAAFTPDGRSVVTASEDGTTRVWDVTSGVELRGTSAWAHDAVFAAGDRVVHSVSGNGYLEKWDARSGKRLWTPKLTTEDETLNGVAMAAGGKFVVTVGDEMTGVVWEAESGARAATLDFRGEERHIDPILAVAAHPTERRVATAGADGRAFVWEWAENTATVRHALDGSMETVPPEAHANGVYAIVYSPDGERLATTGEDDTARIWDEETGELLTTLAGHRDSVRAVAFHPTDDVVATASDDSTVRVWRIGEKKRQTEARQLAGAGGRLYAVAFNRSGTLVAAGGTAGRTYVWAWPSGDLVATLKMHADPINSVAFAADGRILSAGDDYASRIYACPTCGQLPDIVRRARERVAAVG